MSKTDALAAGASLINPALGAGIKIAGGIAGLFGGRKKSKEQEAIEKAVKELEALGVPTAEALTATYERFRSAGELTPELEQTFQQADTELKKITKDPELQDLQRRAIEGIRRDAESTGITLEDRAALDQALGQADQRNRGQQQAILQNLAARGTLSAGDELVQRQMAQQQAAEAQRQAALEAAARSNAARRTALLNLRQQAGAMSEEDIALQQNQATAQDAISRFNVSNRQNVAGSNVDRANRASEANLANRQDILNRNVGLTNTERNNAVSANRDVYDMQRRKLLDKTDLTVGAGRAADKTNEQRRSGIANVVSGAGDLVANTSFKPIKDFFTKPASVKTEEDEDNLVQNQNSGLLNTKRGLT